MMPLSFAKIGEKNTIVRVRGNSEVKRHLNNLGIVEGGSIEVVSEMAGNLILNILDSRVAISKEMAQRIDIETR
ncbi:MAG: FeoA family protein [Anaerovoracaceae bacterium]|jgi:ferrous iron transport protein A